LLRYIEEFDVDMLMPCSDIGLGLVASHYEALRKRVNPGCPPPDSVARVLDKRATLELAARCGIQTPRTWDVCSLASLERIRQTLRFPMIAKPRDHESRRAFTVRHFVKFEELRDEFARDDGFGSRNLLQEFVPGRGVGIATLMHHGEALTLFQHGRLKEFPSAGGVSTVAESEPLDPALASASRALLRELGWDGVAMVEFRRDDATGAWVFMEVNGRYWGSVALALRAGVDFPYYQWQIGHGLKATIPTTYTTGIRTRWSADDVRRLAEVLFKRPDGAIRPPNRLHELRRFLTDYNRLTRSGLGSWSDPLPAVAEFTGVCREMLWGLTKRLVRGIAPDAFTQTRQLRSLGYVGALHHQRLNLIRTVRGGVTRFKPTAPIKFVLFVCSGNIMRSPMAAALFNKLSDAHSVNAVRGYSAGLHAIAGNAADPTACTVASEMGIALETHRAQPVSKELVERANAIFVMDRLNEAEILAQYPTAGNKVYLLASCGDPPICDLDISDPFGRGVDEMRRCFFLISQNVANLVSLLRDYQCAS